MPTPGATVGFVWHFRHQLPLSSGNIQYGIFGRIDISLIYQIGHRGNGCIFQAGPIGSVPPTCPWGEHGLCTAAFPLEVGDETRLYITGSPHRHGSYLDMETRPAADRHDAGTGPVRDRHGLVADGSYSRIPGPFAGDDAADAGRHSQLRDRFDDTTTGSERRHRSDRTCPCGCWMVTVHLPCERQKQSIRTGVGILGPWRARVRRDPRGPGNVWSIEQIVEQLTARSGVGAGTGPPKAEIPRGRPTRSGGAGGARRAGHGR